jgi:two-component system, NarL family, nitrate/nitrite response regulator NarL
MRTSDERGGDAVRVLVVGEDALVRRGLGALLEAPGGLAVLGDAAPGPELEARLEALAPEVIVWDAPPEAAAGEPASLPESLAVPVLALVRDAGQAEEALAAGARGVLPRDADAEMIAAAVRALRRGLVVLDEALARPLLQPPAPEGEAPPEALTQRELEVLRLLAEGLSNRQVAERLAVSEHTAKFHVASILAKLGAQTRTEAVVRAARLGLVYL